MAACVLLMLLAVLRLTSTEDFHGDNISFIKPHKDPDGNIQVAFHHRQNGRNNCVHSAPFTCEECKSFVQSIVMQTDQDNTGQGRWCQSGRLTQANVLPNVSHISLSNKGCCWATNNDMKTNWTDYAHMDLRTRSDTEALNNCPVTTTVSSLRVHQNCFSNIHLLAYDPDGDHVKCHLPADAAVHKNITLNENTCALEKTGHVSEGVYVFEVMLQDFPTKRISLSNGNGTLKYWETSDENASPLCKLKLQFLLEILPSLPICELGHVQPKFLDPTPKHGDVLHATVGDEFILHAKAQAHRATINGFQVSGPHNMNKEFADGEHGIAGLTLTWTPQHSDVYRVVPVCFTAETNESQSAMRCVVVMVSKPAAFHDGVNEGMFESSFTLTGPTVVTCAANRMMVAIKRSTLPDVDVNSLSLNDPSCLVTYNATHIIGSMLFSNCGTTIEDEEKYIFFRNQIQTLRNPLKVVFRRNTVKIGFSCQFPKRATISSSYAIQKSDYIFSDSRVDTFSYLFDVYTDASFTNKVQPSAFPVQVDFLQNVYLSLKAESGLANVRLFLDSCKATPDDNPDNDDFYDLVKEGCVKDPSLRVETVDRLSFHLEFQAFRFDGDNDQVYITCTILMCDVNDLLSRCAMGCLNEEFRRRRRAVGMQTSTQSLTQGPFQFVSEALPSGAVHHNNAEMMQADARENADMDDVYVMKKSDTPKPVSGETKLSRVRMEMKKMLSTNISTMVFGGACSLSVVASAVAIAYHARKSKGNDQKPLLASSCD
ncbi:uncharacterized protein LOC127599722 isoform X1 [Hippocampus zosterae]|uniref:uncharacterized protein LOC127599722 isoform X1 n=1 Tax=Hippocampus zosterae TaxID=109293 RepID=UPI00223CFDC7|nr:uncharacterized protein LOC127599722 isoform X1 [Hippocampus zosterae]